MSNVDISPTIGLSEQYNSFNSNFSNNPLIIVVLTVMIIVFIVGSGSLGPGFKVGSLGANAKLDLETQNIGFIEIFMWGIFVFLILMNGVQYFFGVDITASVKNLLSGKPTIDLTVIQDEPDAVEEIKAKKQVFHIPKNDYTYDDAKAVCAAYGAKLANVNQVQKAHNSGGEWCSYGWSENQMALFPTQDETYKKLQTISGHENDCGRSGINGGYIDNPNVRFGVNCFGYKPEMSGKSLQAMKDTTNKYPKTNDEIAFEKRVDQWKEKVPDILVAPFNHDSWSKI